GTIVTRKLVLSSMEVVVVANSVFYLTLLSSLSGLVWIVNLPILFSSKIN
ncbi:hypothetical protein ACJX0J_015091, partial [Zea mays]